MRRMTIMSLALVSLLLTAARVHAQAARPAATAGVLLATQNCHQGEWCGSPTTFWIVREGNRVRVASKGDGLLVPRRDGFWWLGAMGGTNRFQEREDESLAACDTTRTDSTVTMTDPDADDDPAGSEVQGVIWARRAAPVRDTTQYELQTWSNDATWIDWVTGDWVAYSDVSVDNREHIHTSHAVVRFDALLQPTSDSVPELVPNRAAWERSERACFRRSFGADADLVLADPDAIPLFGSSYWTVRRDRTRWRLARLYYPSSGYDDRLATCDVPAELTASMMGHDRVTIPWSAIRNVLPEADAAFESPAGDLLLVQVDSIWHAFFPREGRPGPVVASFRLGARAVMAQWAVGAHAVRWTREVATLLEQGAPAYRPTP